MAYPGWQASRQFGPIKGRRTGEGLRRGAHCATGPRWIRERPKWVFRTAKRSLTKRKDVAPISFAGPMLDTTCAFFESDDGAQILGERKAGQSARPTTAA